MVVKWHIQKDLPAVIFIMCDYYFPSVFLHTEVQYKCRGGPLESNIGGRQQPWTIHPPYSAIMSVKGRQSQGSCSGDCEANWKSMDNKQPSLFLIFLQNKYISYLDISGRLFAV